MRLLLALSLLFGPLASLRAQEQEGKLVNRLLRPNMELQSSAQNKKFVAGRASALKRANVHAAYLAPRSISKTFSSTRDFSARQFNSWVFNASSNNPAKVSRGRVVPTSMYRASAISTRALPGAERKEQGGAYAGNKPFLDRGKSQKSLERKNAPLTIDEVRELLNKNK